MEKPKKKLSRIITVKLLIAVFTAFVVSFVLTLVILYRSAVNKAYDLVKQNAIDVTEDIVEKTREYFFQVTSMLTDLNSLNLEVFRDNLVEQQIDTTYITDFNGNVIVAGFPEYEGRNVREMEGLPKMLDELNELWATGDYTTLVDMTDKPVLSLNGVSNLYYAIMTLPNYQGLIVFGVNPEEFDQIIVSQGQFVVSNRHIGREGFNVLVGKDRKVFTSPNDDLAYNSEMIHGEYMDELDNPNSEVTVTESRHHSRNNGGAEYDMTYVSGKEDFWGKDYYYLVTTVKDVFYVYSLYPVNEAVEWVNTTMIFVIIIEVFIFSVLFFAVRIQIGRTVVKKLKAVNNSLTEITNGNLEEKVEVRDTMEFDDLSTDINATVDKLKEYIAEAEARIDADLEVAKAIQSSALPNIFPPYPDRKEFELFASMNAAKQVGGDFYDFYMLGNDTLGFLIADVSGKSIPGAMFMMTAKTVIKSLAESGLPPAEVFTQANRKLCEGNDAEMFVTAWMGFLDLNTGLVRVANAGHNSPVLISGGKAEFVRLKAGFVLAGMERQKYKEQSVQLKKGDILFLYTDGVTEAMDKNGKLYGDDSLKELLSYGDNAPAPAAENGMAEAICERVIKGVSEHTAGAEQSDDITMLCIRYLGPN